MHRNHCAAVLSLAYGFVMCSSVSAFLLWRETFKMQDHQIFRIFFQILNPTYVGMFQIPLTRVKWHSVLTKTPIVFLDSNMTIQHLTLPY